MNHIYVLKKEGWRWGWGESAVQDTSGFFWSGCFPASVPGVKFKSLCKESFVHLYWKDEFFDSWKWTTLIKFVVFGGKNQGSSVSKRTVSGWLVKTVRETYQLLGLSSPGAIRAHSTRAMTTYWAMFNGASLIDVMKAADWRSSKTFA